MNELAISTSKAVRCVESAHSHALHGPRARACRGAGLRAGTLDTLIVKAKCCQTCWTRLYSIYTL